MRLGGVNPSEEGEEVGECFARAGVGVEDGFFAWGGREGGRDSAQVEEKERGREGGREGGREERTFQKCR